MACNDKSPMYWIAFESRDDFPKFVVSILLFSPPFFVNQIRLLGRTRTATEMQTINQQKTLCFFRREPIVTWFLRETKNNFVTRRRQKGHVLEV